MPKQKTKKSAVKRFKITKNGKVLRGRGNAQHRKSHKSKRQIRHSKHQVKLSVRQARQVISMIG
jgi:large subunit ribosomal protein L35